MITRILVTGATGHLGSRVAERAAIAGWSVVGTYFSAANLTHPSDFASVVALFLLPPVSLIRASRAYRAAPATDHDLAATTTSPGCRMA